jgi:flagellar assembly factor FliW
MSGPTSPDGVVTFAEGLPGFETSRHFVLVVSPTLDPFTLVQGVDANGPSFLAIDPARVQPDYAARLDPADRLRLDAADADPLVWLALISPKADGAATVNLRAPLVINPASMRGLQLLSAESAHRLDHPLQAA